MSIETVSKSPKKSFTCLALIKKDSQLQRRWDFERLTYCIYEYDKAFDTHELRWCDGSGETIEESDFSDVVLLKQFDESTFDEILGE